MDRSIELLQKHKAEDERRAAILASKRKYANKKILCIHCSKIITQGHRARHLKTHSSVI